MNSEDDFFDFEFSEDNEESTTHSITSVLDDVYGATHKETEINMRKINLNENCRLDNLINLEYNYQKFILKEMEESKVRKMNRWEHWPAELIVAGTKRILANAEGKLQAEEKLAEEILSAAAERKFADSPDDKEELAEHDLSGKPQDKLRRVLLKENMPKGELGARAGVCGGLPTEAGRDKRECSERSAREIFASIEEENVRDGEQQEEADISSLDKKYGGSPSQFQEKERQKLAKFKKREIENRRRTFEMIAEENIDENVAVDRDADQARSGSNLARSGSNLERSGSNMERSELAAGENFRDFI